MRKCYLITVDPTLAHLAGLERISAELGFHVEIVPRPIRDPLDEEDVLVVDVRRGPRDILAQFGAVTYVTRRTRMVVIMDERASSEQRAELIDAGAISAVPANPQRLADLLAQVLREIAELESF
jgi:hypothetical protein